MFADLAFCKIEQSVAPSHLPPEHGKRAKKSCMTPSRCRCSDAERKVILRAKHDRAAAAAIRARTVAGLSADGQHVQGPEQTHLTI